MLLRLLTAVWTVLSLFGFYKVFERMRMDPALVALAFYCVTEIYWLSPCGSDDFVSYYFAMSTV